MEAVKRNAGSPATAARLERRALDVATGLLERAREQRRPHEMWQADSRVALCLQALRDFDAAERFLDDALLWAGWLPVVDARVEVLCEMSELACSAAEQAGPDLRLADTARERARERAGQAVRLAAHVADVHWEAKVLLRASEVLERCGDHDEAADMEQQALRLLGHRSTDGHPDNPGDPLRIVAPAGPLM